MISLTHIEAALSAVDAEIKALLYNQSLSLTEKDEKMPIASNKTKEGRAENRRIEVELCK